ncbi:MAG: hypothetical protein PHE67_05965 [Campylobacterales bacterium]|nr:hypothetical protein [Campylobacterales bacterium]
MSTDQNSTAAQVKNITDKLQEYGVMLPGKAKFFGEFLTAHPGIIGSVGVLVEKIGNGTAQSRDYIEVAKDITDVGVGTVGMLNPGLGFKLYRGKEVVFDILDYADAHNYDVKEIKDDLTKKFQNSWDELKNKLQEIKNNLFSDASGEGVSKMLAGLTTATGAIDDGVTVDPIKGTLGEVITVWNQELSSKYGNDVELYTDTQSGTQFIANSSGDVLAIVFTHTKRSNANRRQ